VKAITESGNSLIFIIALILLSCAVVFSEEEGSGEHRIYLTTKKGHGSLAMAKLFALMCYSAGIFLLYFFGKLIIAGKLLGFGDISRSLQSISDFRNCCYSISVKDFLALSLLLPLAAVLFISLFTAFLCTVFSRIWVSVLIMGGYTGLSFFAYADIADNSVINFLKFLNPFALYDTGSRFSSYANVDLFGFPCTVLTTVFILGAVFTVLFGILYFMAYSGKLKVTVPAVTLKRMIRIRGSVRLFSQEVYRLMIPGFGIIALTVLAVLSYNRILKSPASLSKEDYYYYAYGQELSGPIGPETGNWFTEKRMELMEEQSRVAEDYASDENLAALKLSDINLKMKALDRVYLEYMQLLPAFSKGIPVHYISSIVTDPVFGDQSAYLLQGMLMMMILCISSSHLFSEDEETELIRLVKTTKHGRRKVFFTRYGVILLLYTLGFLLFKFPVLYNWLRIYKMSDFSAPVQSITSFSNADHSMTIALFTALWTVGSFISGAVFLAFCSALSSFIKKKSTVMAFSAVLIAVDFLCVIMDFPVVKYVGAASGFGLPSILNGLSSTVWVYVILGKNVCFLGLMLLLHWRKREKLL